MCEGKSRGVEDPIKKDKGTDENAMEATKKRIKREGMLFVL